MDISLLIAVLRTPEDDEEEQLMALVEQLRAPMAAQGSDLKKYLKDTILPAFQQIKETHNAIEDKGRSLRHYMRPSYLRMPAVDIAFGAGILTFDEVCKKVERIALRDEDDLRTARAESQVRLVSRSGPSSSATSTMHAGKHAEDPGGA